VPAGEGLGQGVIHPALSAEVVEGAGRRRHHADRDVGRGPRARLRQEEAGQVCLHVPGQPVYVRQDNRARIGGLQKAESVGKAGHGVGRRIAEKLLAGLPGGHAPTLDHKNGVSRPRIEAVEVLGQRALAAPLLTHDQHRAIIFRGLCRASRPRHARQVGPVGVPARRSDQPIERRMVPALGGELLVRPRESKGQLAGQVLEQALVGGDEARELLGIQRVEGRRFTGHHIRRDRRAGEEGHLAEVAARPEPRDRQAKLVARHHDHVQGPRLDHIQACAYLALMHDGLPGLHRDRRGDRLGSLLQSLRAIERSDART